MRDGERYRLRRAINGLSLIDGKVALPVTVPKRAIVEVTRCKKTFVDVLWEGRTCTLFAIDLRARADLLAAGREAHDS